MGKEIENNCLYCDNCIDCGMKRETVFRCDKCGNVRGQYIMDEKMYCEECLKRYLREENAWEIFDFLKDDIVEDIIADNLKEICEEFDIKELTQGV